MTKKISLIIISCLVVVVSFCTILFTQNKTKKVYATEFYSNAQSAIVIQQGSDRVFYQKNVDLQLPIASTTKILTAITVIENTDNLEKVVKVPDSAVGVEGSSIYLQKGEKLRIIDLLYGLMLQSGNDCAESLAIITSGSIEQFAVLMNDMAVKTGAINSSFKNPHGLPNDEHYSTAYDLAMISNYAMNNDTFRKIVSCTTYNDCTYHGRDYNRIIKNKNKTLWELEGGDGIKTGYTKKAGRCLVSSATRYDETVICVVLNCPDMFNESYTLINSAFSIIKAEQEELIRLQM